MATIDVAAVNQYSMYDNYRTETPTIEVRMMRATTHSHKAVLAGFNYQFFRGNQNVIHSIIGIKYEQ